MEEVSVQAHKVQAVVDVIAEALGAYIAQPGAAGVVAELERGTTRYRGPTGWVETEPNHTGTITIRVNGGAIHGSR